MAGNRPLISVIMPVYNGERYLAEAIASALAQRDQHLEVVVGDDGSTDRSAAIARSFGTAVRVIEGPHEGIGSARNRAIAAAGGEYLAFLDADDLWPPGRLAAQLAAFAADPSIDGVFGAMEQFISPDLSPELARRLHYLSGVTPARLPGTLLIARAAFDRVGPFGTGWRVAEFTDWYLRAVEAGLRLPQLPDLVLRRRLHDANQGVRQRAARGDYARALKLSLDRRRAAAGTGVGE
jgi:glycosyltransferase involved in cell wall biosynthesis